MPWQPECEDSFDQAEPKYKLRYFDQTTGSYVLLHRGRNRGESFESELFIAETFAKDGSIVILLDESDGREGKRPDAEIDGEIWDFKRLTPEAIAFANRVQADIREARNQGAVKAAYHIDRENYDLNEIKRGTARAFRYDVEKQLQLVVYLLPTGERVFYGRNIL